MTIDTSAMAHETSDTKLLELETTMCQDHCQLLSSLAQHLRSAASALDLKATDIENQNLCARRAARMGRKDGADGRKGEFKQGGRETTAPMEDRVISGAIAATIAVKQDLIIKQAVQSLLESTLRPSSETEIGTKKLSGGILVEDSLDGIANHVYELAATKLVEAQLRNAQQTLNEPSTLKFDTTSASLYGDSDWGNTPVVSNTSLEFETNPPCPPEHGFVTASGWVAINRRQHGMTMRQNPSTALLPPILQ